MHTFRMAAIRMAAIGAALGGLAACASGQNAQYKVVTESYEATANDEGAHSWRALMEALDRCHFAGYQDAQLADMPQRVCKSGDENNCALYRVTLKYDCIGLGYQTSS